MPAHGFASPTVFAPRMLQHPPGRCVRQAQHIIRKGLFVKLLVLAAPLALALTALPAQAQDRVVHSTTVTHQEASVHREDSGPHHSWRWKRMCHTRWAHHKKIRTCKNVRVRW
jgi:uncharacterized protein (DUF2384 family)